MEITAPSIEDADALADLWVALARDQRSYGSHLLPDANRSAVRETLLRRIVGGDALVAREDERLLGFVTYAVESSKYEQDVARGLVQNIYVVPDRRGDGVGSDLLAAAERDLADAGADRVTLEVMAANEAARRFYRRHGYEAHRVELEKRPESDTL